MFAIKLFMKSKKKVVVFKPCLDGLPYRKSAPD